MRREPATLAIVTLVVYGATVLLYVRGILYPGENPLGPTSLVDISPLSLFSATCLFPLSILFSLLTGVVSLVISHGARRRAWSRLFGGILLLALITAVLALIAVQHGRGVPDGVVLALVGLGIVSGVSLFLLPVLALATARRLTSAGS